MRRETFATEGPVRISVKLAAGRVELETAETAEAVVELEPLNDRARQAVEDALVELRGGELRVDVDQKRFLLMGRTPEVRVTVRAPSGSSAQVASAAAEISGRGRFGEIDVKTAAGDVEFDDVERDATVNAVSGDVRIGSIGGEAAVKSVSGDVLIEQLARGGRVQTVSGDVALEALTEGKLAVKTVSGDVRAGIRRGSGLWIDAKSVSGKTTSDLELGDEAPAEPGPLVELQAASVSGDIRVVRASSVSA